MSWKLYKEGQGKWARNSVAAVIAILSVFFAASFYESLADPAAPFEIRNTLWERWFHVSTWGIDYRFVIVAPLLVALLAFGVWQYNRPRWADFLIDTENELKNRVTWPSRKEVLGNSIVVLVAVVIIGAWTFTTDLVLRFLFQGAYRLF